MFVSVRLDPSIAFINIGPPSNATIILIKGLLCGSDYPLETILTPFASQESLIGFKSLSTFALSFCKSIVLKALCPGGT